MFDIANKYKEVTPQETISRIKNLLSQHGIETAEDKWWNKSHSVLPSSVTVKVKNVPFSTNGKGVSDIFALASGYAEFMERLQNISMPRSKFRLDASKNHYLKTPDRKLFDTALFRKSKELSIFDEDYNNFIEQEFAAGNSHLGFAVKYLHVNSGKIEYLPDELLSVSAGSNGMCAGNTMSEALVQGCCEIFERLVLKKIYTENNVRLPKIQKVYLEKHPMFECFLYLEANGYDVCVRDCSFGQYPVAGLFIKKGDLFKFNLGAAPDFALALERCLTEIFQGKTQQSFDQWMIKNNGLKNDAESYEQYWEKQLWKSFTSYSGNLREGILTDDVLQDSPEFSLSGQNNDQTLGNLLALLVEKENDVYIRDVSFLGFPTYHIYVPSVSNIIKTSLNNLKICRDVSRATTILHDLGGAEKEDLRVLIRVIERLLTDKSIFLSGDNEAEVLPLLLNLPLEQGISSSIDLKNILSFLYYHIGDYQSALKNISHDMNSDPNKGERFDHVKCLRDAIYHTSENKDFAATRTLLKEEYDAQVTEAIVSILENIDHLAEYLMNLKRQHSNENMVAFCTQLQKVIDNYSFDQVALQKHVDEVLYSSTGK